MADDDKNGWTVETLKEHFDKLRQGDKEAVVAALNAADKAVSAALESANKAADKGEEAQLRVNITQNEFRGALKDQAATLLPRAEYESQHERLQTEVDGLKKLVYVGLGVLAATQFIITLFVN